MTQSPATPASAVTAVDLVRDRIERLSPKVRVLVLQHPQEQDTLLGTAPLLAASLDKSVLRVGLSWSSLAHAMGETDNRFAEPEPNRWAVLYRGSIGRTLTAREKTEPFLLLDRKGKRCRPDELPIEGFVILDGTWSQAKTMWWRNPWLLKLHRVLLHPTQPSAYGRLRKQPSPQHISTLEAAALTLDGLGEDPVIGEQLRRVFRTLCQRGRDANISLATDPEAADTLETVQALGAGKTAAEHRLRPRATPAKARKKKRDDVAF
ncbi:MAG: tRNA-uridine aminocarboxypropyltransferase [Deltaproteobacteria bacterium]|nr:tRNA-uridine aminocarboxypropyltransferase [Deltaproteobacteria bacterium]